jgi:uncharacterized protein (TIGR02466 family)
MNDVKIFPTLLGYTLNFLNTKECSGVLKQLKKIKTFKHPCLTGKAASTHTLQSSFSLDDNLRNKLTQKINDYATQYGIAKLKLDNSWINIQSKKSLLIKHSHPNSIISGVLYLKADKNSSPLHFYNPNPFLSFIDIKNITGINSPTYYVTPATGSLFLFPSWLLHGSEKLNNSKERIALSFNTAYL